jgi:hypothetical protein
MNLYGMHPVVYQYHILSFISVKHNYIPMNPLSYNVFALQFNSLSLVFMYLYMLLAWVFMYLYMLLA